MLDFIDDLGHGIYAIDTGFQRPRFDAAYLMVEDGRAAFILPWEFLNAGYGGRIKAYLLEAGVLRHAVVFDSARGVFAGAVTTACILLLGRDGKPGDVAL